MKVLIAIHPCMDLGGIINHTEQLFGGLKDLGHEVDFKEIAWTNQSQDHRKRIQLEVGPSGIPFDQGAGWNFKYTQRIAYKGSANCTRARFQLEKYDLIIWTVPVPTKSNKNLGNKDWPHLYDIPVKQIAIIHDGNSRRNSPHLLAIEDHLTGVVCVHPCAYNTSDFLKVPRRIIFNPQDCPVRILTPWGNKLHGFVNMQTFKAWKHVHELIGSIRYMPKKQDRELREVAGKGIEYQYMTSEEKCKSQYFHPDGKRYWQAALANGMVHHASWTTEQVDRYLTQARVLVDPSWSRRYAESGGHFNRVVVDAMMRGCIPVAKKIGMGSEMFQPFVHYIPLPEEDDLKAYAQTIVDAWNMGPVEAELYRQAARELLPVFDRRVIAQQYLDFAMQQENPKAVNVDKELKAKYEDVMFNHFGILV